MVSLKSLERLDALDGIVTRREDKHPPKEESEKRHQPMFVMPDGTRLSLHVDRKAIDVTPGRENDD